MTVYFVGNANNTSLLYVCHGSTAPSSLLIIMFLLLLGITFKAIRKVLKKASDRDGMRVKTMAGFMGLNYQQRQVLVIILDHFNS